MRRFVDFIFRPFFVLTGAVTAFGAINAFCLRYLSKLRLLAPLLCTALVLVWGATRAVKGTVTDQNGNQVIGAVVQIKDTRSLHIRSYVTQENGMYQFHGLSPEMDYELFARFDGATSSKRPLSRFDSKKLAVIDLVVNLNSRK